MKYPAFLPAFILASSLLLSSHLKASTITATFSGEFLVQDTTSTSGIPTGPDTLGLAGQTFDLTFTFSTSTVAIDEQIGTIDDGGLGGLGGFGGLPISGSTVAAESASLTIGGGPSAGTFAPAPGQRIVVANSGNLTGFIDASAPDITTTIELGLGLLFSGDLFEGALTINNAQPFTADSTLTEANFNGVIPTFPSTADPPPPVFSAPDGTEYDVTNASFVVTATVPEPSSVALTVLAGCLGLTRRRRG